MTELDERFLTREKRVDNGEWIEGYLFRLSESLNLFIMLWKQSGSFFAIDINTIGQCTGVKDKNGKMIFEGDIVLKRTYNGRKPFPVKFDGGMFYAGIGGGSSTATHRYTLEDKQIEVIGNIHDNAELLRQ